jgi:hypothetical protein
MCVCRFKLNYGIEVPVVRTHCRAKITWNNIISRTIQDNNDLGSHCSNNDLRDTASNFFGLSVYTKQNTFPILFIT